MDSESNQKINSFKLYEKYSRRDVHAVFSDGTRYAEGGGVWGRSGVIKPKGYGNAYILFCLIKPRLVARSAQFIGANGYFRWISQPSMSPESQKFQSLVQAGKGESPVLLFAKAAAGPLYSYIGRLEYVSYDKATSKPVYVEWKIRPWPMPKAEMDVFVAGHP